MIAEQSPLQLGQFLTSTASKGPNVIFAIFIAAAIIAASPASAAPSDLAERPGTPKGDEIQIDARRCLGSPQLNSQERRCRASARLNRVDQLPQRRPAFER